jgi:hypothetical protein
MDEKKNNKIADALPGDAGRKCTKSSEKLECRDYEGIAKLATRVKFDDFFVCSIFCKVTYPFGHRHVAKN